MILRPSSNKNCLLFQLNFFLIKSLSWVCEERRESEILDLGRLMFSDDTFRRLQNDLHHVLQASGVQAATPLLPYSCHRAPLSHTHCQPEYESNAK